MSNEFQVNIGLRQGSAPSPLLFILVMELMWVGKQREELNIRLEGKDIKQVNNFVYLGGNISENGRVDVEVRRRIQAGVNAWRNVEGVMMDRKISRKLKVLDSCVVPASTY